MKIGAALVVAGVLLGGLAACGSDEDSPSDADSTVVEKQAGTSGWQLTWSDEFDGPAGTKPDPGKWGYKTGSMPNNKELQLYTDSDRNASMDGAGNLVITALKETPPGSSCWYGKCEYTSARIKTEHKFSQTYGRFEAEIQVPSGKGLWPAFWTLGEKAGSESWPANGEIDIMEILGNDPSKLYGTLHGPGYSGAGGIGKSFTLPAGESFADGFHTFAVEWEPEEVRWYADDKLYETRTPADLPEGTKWVYDHPFYMLLNLAVGGDWPGSPDAATAFPAQMKINNVRVFERAEGEAPAN